MKKFLTIAAFFWACTFTQQAQHIESKGFNKWSNDILTYEQYNDSLSGQFSSLHASKSMRQETYQNGSH
jgi:hypothetical protein